MVVMRFGSIQHLLEIKDEDTLAAVFSSLSCLSVIAKSKNVEDISILVDIISSIRVRNKYVMIQTPPLNTTLLQSKMINFNVMISEVASGKSITPTLI